MANISQIGACKERGLQTSTLSLPAMVAPGALSSCDAGVLPGTAGLATLQRQSSTLRFLLRLVPCCMTPHVSPASHVSDVFSSVAAKQAIDIKSAQTRIIGYRRQMRFVSYQQP